MPARGGLCDNRSMRSERIHHQVRLKAKRRFHWGRDLRGDARELGKAVASPAICSCWLCSPGKRGEASVRERSAFEVWRKIEQA